MICNREVFVELQAVKKETVKFETHIFENKQKSYFI